MRRYLHDSLPGRWTYLPEKSMEVPMAIGHWWKQFNNPLLDSLITLGVDNNYNLAMALRRTQIARNAVGQTRAGWLPTVSANAG